MFGNMATQRVFAPGVVWIAIACLASAAFGQNKRAQPQKMEMGPPTRNSQALLAPDDEEKAAAAFDKAFNEYRGAIRQIEQLRIDFQTADEAKRAKINADLPGLAANAQKLAKTMIEAAMETYRLSPNGDPRATDLLIEMVKYYVVGQQTGPGEPASAQPEQRFYPIQGGDQYERALPIIKRLVDGGATEKGLYVWGFLSAFCTNDYDLAEAYWKKAQEVKALEEMSKGANEEKELQAGATRQTIELAAKFAPLIGKYREMWAKETAIRAAEAQANDLPRVKLTTTKGEITLELFENEAPQSVANFLTLVKQGFYDGTPFHRVLPGFMAQGGAKTDDGGGGPGYSIRGEHVLPNARNHFRGSMSMARKGGLPNSGSSQFFLTFVPTTHLDHEHAVFGRVIDGFDVLGELQRRSPQHQQHPPKPDRITKAEVLRDRGNEYKFDRLPPQ